MGRRSEKGEGRLGSIVMLFVVIAAVYAGFHVAPVYMDHYSFSDKLNEIARTPKYRAPTDEKVLDILMKEVRERGMSDWIGRENFVINTTDVSRRIRLSYERQAEILPSWTYTFRFNVDADQPLV
jgi:hypothetical protein